MMLGGGPAGSGGSTGTFTGGGWMGGRAACRGGSAGRVGVPGTAGAGAAEVAAGTPGAVGAGAGGVAGGAGAAGAAGTAGAGFTEGVWAVKRPAMQSKRARERYMKWRLGMR